MPTRHMLQAVTIFFLMFGFCFSYGQSTGDTIRVNAFNFNSDSRDTLIAFPSDDDLSFEKVLLKYTMRCKDGLISTGTNVNQGCGEWDFSCNTYLADSTKPESVLSIIPSHFITNFEELDFPYSETPVYDYMRGTQTSTEITNTNNENSVILGIGTEQLNRTFNTANLAGKSYYLYTADELISAGFQAGEIHGLSLKVLEDAGEAKFLKIKIKNTIHAELSGLIDFENFTEVYYNDKTFTSNDQNRFQFHNPFEWDGTSNIILEFNFTNVEAPSLITHIEGETTTTNMGLSSTNEQEIILTNNAYIQCDNYFGVDGDQNRTIEAWIKTTDGSNGEIIGWGTNITGRKWVFRFVDGLLRLEVHGGGTVSSTRVDDGVWHHVACVLNGNDLGDVSFYLDGVLDENSTTGTTAISSNTTTNIVRISRGVNNRYLDATVDDVRVWDTNLSEETINQWKNLKVDATHPNYENLQLYYQFDGNSDTIVDSSPHGRNGTLIGERFNVSELAGPTLFKDFKIEQNRPNVTFHQGDYDTNVITTEVDRPIAKSSRHFVITRSIEETDPTFAKDDNIIVDGPIEYWNPEEIIFDETTGEVLSVVPLSPDGEINISSLEYQRRFPFYNELVSFVTPYGIGLDLGQDGASWTIDLSDYVSILKGDKRILMTLGGQRQEDMDLEFQFIVGTPPRDVVQYEQIWQGTNRIGIANINQILSDEKFAPVDIEFSSEAKTIKLRSSITGHGSEGEFQQNGGVVNHLINLNQSPTFAWSVNKECSFNPIYPQGGTWIYDRQGWCPGERTIVTENDLTPFVNDGISLNLDYNTTPPSNSTGDYRYHVAHQLVAYGEANFQTDASITNIIAPNNAPEFLRVGTICANPTIVIQNTGAERLSSLTIKYWLNDSQSPQIFEWNGGLEFMESAEVVVPNTAELWFDLLAENNSFHAEISAPNGSADQYEFNNSFRTDFEFPEVLSNNLTLEFRTNNIPTQNSYELIDGEGNLIGSNNLPSANTTYSDEFNLPDGCYKLIVTDNGGDGVEWWANAAQGTGFIRMIDGNGSLIKIFEPDFGGGFEFSFSTSFPVSSEDLGFLKSIEIFPNPASDFVTVLAEDLMNSNISLVNAMGQQVMQPIQSYNNDGITINTAQLGSGLYYVVIQKDKIVTTRKLILE